YKKAMEMGFDKLATGHYISIKKEGKKIKKQNREAMTYYLCVARDKQKDQSYFLYNLTQDILSNVFFPLGYYQKSDIKKMAKKWKLPIKEKESQDICFLQNGDHNEFLKKYLKMKKGDIVTVEGEKIGEHHGLSLYTIGQRKNIGIGGACPYYVVEKNEKKNILIVSEDKDDPLLYKTELYAEDVNWISDKEPKMPMKIKARIRYRHEAMDATVVKLEGKECEYDKKYKERKLEISFLPKLKCRQENWKLEIGDRYIVKFKKPQWAITPGQSVVFYKGDKILGGGIILPKYPPCPPQEGYLGNI
ncbi:MAG: tRNA methyl transferase PRC-barrel domain-containing protein, partial [bacterium]